MGTHTVPISLQPEPYPETDPINRRLSHEISWAHRRPMDDALLDVLTENGTLRFLTYCDKVPGISQKMLTQNTPADGA